MKKVKWIQIGLVCSLAVMGQQAKAARDGGGCGALRCNVRSSSGVRAKTTLLEFWEAENKMRPFTKRYKILRSEEAVDKQILAALGRLKLVNPRFGDLVQKTLEEKVIGFAEWRTGYRVSPPTDTLQNLTPEGCRRVGLGSYSDFEGILSYDPEYLAQMLNTDQSGFWTHEAIYKTFRDATPGDILERKGSSVETRVINARLYSNKPMVPLRAKPKGALRSFHCERSARNEYWTEPSNELEFYLHVLKDKIIFVPVYISLIEDNKPWGTHFVFRDEIKVPISNKKPVSSSAKMYLKSKYSTYHWPFLDLGLPESTEQLAEKLSREENPKINIIMKLGEGLRDYTISETFENHLRQHRPAHCQIY